MKRIVVACLVPIAALVATVANADEFDDRLVALERENASLKKQLRIEALERENAALRKKLTSSRASQDGQVPELGRQRFPQVASVEPVAVSIKRASSLATVNSIKPVSGAYAAAAVLPAEGPLQPTTWTGFYFGSYFGLARLNATEAVSSTSTFSSSSTSNFGGSFTSNTSTNRTYGLGNATGSHTGATGALSIGWQSRLADNIVAGFQIDGGLSNIQARLSGGATNTSTLTTISDACGGPRPGQCTPVTSSSTSSSSAITSINDTLAHRWFVSALVKAGFLIDPYSLIYALGGWSYANFEAPSVQSSFGANGVTVGAGIERRISPIWSLKAEYRYTKFQNTTVSLPVTSTSTGTSSASNSNSSSFTETATRFNVDMHSALIGIARSFDLY